MVHLKKLWHYDYVVLLRILANTFIVRNCITSYTLGSTVKYLIETRVVFLNSFFGAAVASKSVGHIKIKASKRDF